MKKFVGDLNGDPARVMAWEWELVLLNALNKMGTLKYEQSMEGKKPDVLFSLEAPLKGFFLAEVTTASDKSDDEKNPIKELRIALSRLVRKRGLQPNNFAIAVGNDWQGIFHSGAKPRLKIPRKQDFKSVVFTPRFDCFLSEIRSSPKECRVYEVMTGRVDLTISYEHHQRFSSATYMTYDIPYSLERNTVFKALDKKARQLRLSGHPGPLGIFLCDGGSNLLESSPRTFQITADDIIRRFLEKHPYIAFVQVFWVASDWDMAWGSRKLSIRTRVYQGCDFDALSQDLQNTLKSIVAHLPEPENDAASARSTLMRWPNTMGHSFRGGYSMTRNSVKISSRILLDLLAGRMDQAEFRRQVGLSPYSGSGAGPNIFEQWLGQGRLIYGIEIERCPEKDDDWITITVSDPDPAISKFVLQRHIKET